MIIAFQKSAEALVATSLFVSAAVFSLGTLIYFAERSTTSEEFSSTKGGNAVEVDKFNNIPNSIWFAIVTAFTTGYGDMVPHSITGKFLSFMVMQSGSLMIALPSIIVGRNYLAVWESMKKFRKAIQQKSHPKSTRRYKIAESSSPLQSTAALNSHNQSGWFGGQTLLSAANLGGVIKLPMNGFLDTLGNTVGTTKTAVTDFFQRNFGIQAPIGNRSPPHGSRQLEEGGAGDDIEIPRLAAPPSATQTSPSSANQTAKSSKNPTNSGLAESEVSKTALIGSAPLSQNETSPISISVVPPSPHHSAAQSESGVSDGTEKHKLLDKKGSRRRRRVSERASENDESIQELLRDSERINRRLRDALRSQLGHFNISTIEEENDASDSRSISGSLSGSESLNASETEFVEFVQGKKDFQ